VKKSKVPSGWMSCSLGSLGELSAGGTPSTRDRSFWDKGTIRWMSSGEIHQKHIREVKGRITNKGYQNSNAKLLPVGTILIALAGQGKTRGTVAITNIEVTTNQSVGAVKIKHDKVLPLYLFHNLDRRYQELRRISLGDGRAGLNLDILRKLQVLLPPLPEQKEIAKILSTWDRAIETLAKLIVTKTRLKKGLMQKLLNSKGKQIILKDIAEIVFSNVDKKSYSGQRQVSLCNYLDVYNNTYITSNLPFMQATASEAEINKFSLKEGDVIITKDSETPEDIGIPAVVVEKLKGVICGYHLAIIRPDTDKINPVYLAKELTTLRIKKQFYKYANGATRFGLGTGDIGKIEIVVPKLDDQVKISRLFQSMDREASLFAMVREHWQSQKQGLMQKLLTGKIRVKDGAK